MLPLVRFDKKSSRFPRNSVILRYFWVKLRQKCPFLKIPDAALKSWITLWECRSGTLVKNGFRKKLKNEENNIKFKK